MPNFEGEIDKQSGLMKKIILNFEYQTICRGENSMFKALIKEGINPLDYITILSLRKHDVSIKDKPATELIYVHSKIMLVDDTSAIIGSANITDRSLLGNRDSEIAVS